MFSWNTIHDTK